MSKFILDDLKQVDVLSQMSANSLPNTYSTQFTNLLVCMECIVIDMFEVFLVAIFIYSLV